MKPQGECVSCAVRIQWSGKIKVALLLGYRENEMFSDTVRTPLLEQNLDELCFLCSLKSWTHRCAVARAQWKPVVRREVVSRAFAMTLEELATKGTDKAPICLSRTVMTKAKTREHIFARTTVAPPKKSLVLLSWKSGNRWVHKTTREPLNVFSWNFRNWITQLKFVHQAQFRLRNIYRRFELTYSLHLQGQAVLEF